MKNVYPQFTHDTAANGITFAGGRDRRTPSRTVVCANCIDPPALTSQSSLAQSGQGCSGLYRFSSAMTASSTSTSGSSEGLDTL